MSGFFGKPRLRLTAWLALAASLLAGCAEELGPVDRPTARVTGRVRIGSTPVGGGWVELIPAEGTTGDLRSAPLRPDGSFEADRVAAGTVTIRLVNPPVPLPGFPSEPRVGFDQFTSPIRREVRDGDSLDIDLRAEQIRFLREGPRR